ncbi:MAG: ATP-binding cassette domain-containing protein, partial [Sulfuricaulis sp.]|nr:ATP-binding cassette domain-containing protein [Sulfuricaulis sp.]
TASNTDLSANISMPLLRLDKVSLAYGHRPLLEQAKLEIRRGERVCLVGRNGEGKSSLIRLLSGEALPDDGKIWIRPGTRIAHLAQEVSPDSDESVFDIVAGGLAGLGKLISQYHHTATELAHAHTPALTQRLAQLQHELEAGDGWRLEQRVEMVLSRLGLDGDVSMHALSGGWRRRAMLARALVCEPDLLLLDEPTNHLDIEAITWLEEFLVDYPGALLFVSHDRAFLKRLATRIIELDRGALTSWPGSYDDYVRRKQAQLAVEAQHNALFDKKLSQEEAWIRQGVEARRTRNEGRVRALEALREERRRRLNRAGKVELKLEEGRQSGQLVFEAEHVEFSFGDTVVIKDFSVRVMRGDRIGIVGPNGAGKSTLIKLLLGELPPTRGQLRRGTKLQVAYFDQQRAQLDPKVTVMDSVGGGSQTVTINGRSQHVAGYLQNFLFPPERLRSPVSTLSGGERNRLLLARLFAQPANLLVMDEPTNDLDVETLELLEELLLEYQGTLLLVSHDRAFLDNAVTSTLVFEGDGRIGEYVGGYTDWLRQRRNPAAPGTEPPRAKTQSPASPSEKTRAKAPPPASAAEKHGTKPRKLSYKEQREIETLPGKIETLEVEQSQLQAAVSAAGFYQQPGEAISATLARLQSVTAELEEYYARWEALESLATAAK